MPLVANLHSAGKWTAMLVSIPSYEIRVDLIDAQPTIWRTLLVPADIRLHHLHNVLQVTMGWTNSHLHEFRKGRTVYGVPAIDGDDFGQKIRRSCKYQIDALLKKPKQSFVYSYDFGDDWEHQVTLLSIRPEPCKTIRCLAGERACPPEDCGGTSGYEDLLATLANPDDPEYNEKKNWFDAMTPHGHDPAVFPIAAVNKELAQGLDHLVHMIWGDPEAWAWVAGKSGPPQLLP